MSDVALRFRLTPDGSKYVVHFTCEGFDPAKSAFEADTREGHLATVVQLIEENRARDEHLMYAGSALWASLVTGEVGARYEQVMRAADGGSPFYQVRLSLPPELRALPWETLYDERRVGFLAAAENYCIVHDPPEGMEARPMGARDDGPVRILVAVPEGSGLDVGREWRNLKTEVERLGSGAPILERVQGRVTTDLLRAELAKGWDVFHFIGHGGLDDEGRVTLRLNCPRPDEGDVWLDAETFSRLFRPWPVRLAVLNSCLGGAQSDGKSLSGAAPFLLRDGVPAVVAMRYEIYEPDALTFTPAFYRELLTHGRVDKALEHARLQLKLHPHDESKRGFVTPVLSVVTGCEQLFQPRSPLAGARPSVPYGLPPPMPSVELPEGLIAAFRSGQVVPIIGPALLRAGVVRGSAVAPAAPGPRELADILSERFAYPAKGDFDATDQAPWTAEALLLRVCQHCAYVHDGVFQIVEAIEETYRNASPPSAFTSLAGWRVPGMVYTFFDGLLSRAAQDANRAFQVVNALSEQVPPDAQHPLLVHLRGTIADTSSLVLTEGEFEKLADRMDRLSGAIAGLATRKPGRSILFVGVHPRDVLVRRFVRALMGDETRRRLQGKSYFVSADHSPVDDAYWAQYKVCWVEAGVLDFVEAATPYAAGAGR